MKFLDNLWVELFFSDPGYLCLKQALKTVTALLLSVAFCHFFLENLIAPPFLIIFLMQAHQGKTKKQKMFTQALAFIVFTMCFFIGVYLKAYSLLVFHSGLILLAFLAFYVQRFGERFTRFPLFAWVMYFFALILPPQNSTQLWYNFIGVLMDFPITFILYFYVFPDSNKKIFFDNFRLYYTKCRQMLLVLQSFFQKKISAADFTANMQQKLDGIRDLVLMNQSVFETVETSHADHQLALDEYYFEEYERTRGLAMAFEATKHLCAQGIGVPESLSPPILKIMDYYLVIFQSMRIDDKTYSIDCSFNAASLETALDAYKNAVLRLDLPENQLTIFWNLYLGFIQMSKVMRDKYVYR